MALIPNARSLTPQGLNGLASGLIVATILIGLLYIGREILLPLVIAGLLAFILSPIIRRMRGWGVRKAPAVIATVLLALAALSTLAFTIGAQIAQLADDLPKYESNLRAKVRIFQGVPIASGAMEKASETLRDLRDEITKPSAPAPGARRREAEQKPLLVEISQPAPSGIEAIGNLIKPLLSPLATTALVILFLLFILAQREDIRDRFLRLAGTQDLQRTTSALDDAASRLSRFFLMQTLLNIGFGVVIAVGLAIIGVPNAVLWGILAGLMRFVPFIGGLIAAFFPIALAAAVDPGWSLALWTAALFLISEPIAGHVVEPMLYSQHTGLSPVAIVVSTLFWTILWGPIGLLLATPLTVCLVVFGKHIEALKFVDVLLGDEPALKPEERFYQRLLAGDATEAADQAERQLKEQSLSGYYDAVAMKALMLAQLDAAQGKLTRDKQRDISDTIEEIVDDLSDYPDEAPPPKEGEPDGETPPTKAIPVLSKDQLAAAWQVAHPVLCVGSRSALDQAAAIMLAQLLAKHGIGALVQPFADVRSASSWKVDAPDTRLVCLSYFGAAANPAHVRYLIRRLKRFMPDAKFLACFWSIGEDSTKMEEWKTAVGAHLVATSLADAVEACVNEARDAPEQVTLESVQTRIAAPEPVR